MAQWGWAIISACREESWGDVQLCSARGFCEAVAEKGPSCSPFSLTTTVTFNWVNIAQVASERLH